MYARDTVVPVERTKVEIEKLIEKHGANQFSSGWSGDCAVIAFRMGESIRKVPTPVPRRGWNHEGATRQTYTLTLAVAPFGSEGETRSG